MIAVSAIRGNSWSILGSEATISVTSRIWPSGKEKKGK